MTTLRCAARIDATTGEDGANRGVTVRGIGGLLTGGWGCTDAYNCASMVLVWDMKC